MADIFGIGVRVMNSIREYSRKARGTGRSYVLSDMVQDGDCIVFARKEHVIDFAEIQKSRGRTTHYRAVTVDPVAGDAAVMVATAGLDCNRLFFDHVWLEEYYHSRISHLASALSNVSAARSKEEI